MWAVVMHERGLMANIFSFKPLDTNAAQQMLRWSYEAPYDLYNVDTTDEQNEIDFLTNPAHRYFSIWQRGVLVGFCCFGAEARVPGGDYTDDALDVGMGMRPDLTGQGNGSQYIQAVLNFARVEFEPVQLRATVVAFNERAQRACKKAGLQVTQTFLHAKNQRRFVVLVGPATPSPLSATT